MSEGRVLLVDDNEVVLEVIRGILEQAGYEVITLGSAFRINSVISKQRPDVILLDVRLPGLRGDKAASILKQYEFSRRIPVLLFSETDEEELVSLVEITGATGFIRKADDYDHLLEKVRQAIAEARAAAHP